MAENGTQEQGVSAGAAAPRDYTFDRLSEAFETSARRWELIVYPSLFAFIILAAYGFYLVYSLARDVHYLAISVDTNMTVLASNMQSVSENMVHITSNLRAMTGHLDEINDKVGTLEPMLTNMDSMDQSMDSIDRAIQSITLATHGMRSDMAIMNQSVSRPLSVLNTIMPW